MYHVIIVGGGSGSRFASDIPKQFHLLAGKPVLMHTIHAFTQAFPTISVHVVLNIHHHEVWKELCKKHSFSTPHELIKGGNTRFESVKNGLKNIPNTAIVAVHDAVRPLIDIAIIQQAFSAAEALGNAIVVMPANESLRHKTGKGTEAVKREEYVLVQTPQIFKASELKKAYQQPFRNEFTDDASVVERLGTTIYLVEGNSRNIKITYPHDLAIAESLMSLKS